MKEKDDNDYSADVAEEDNNRGTLFITKSLPTTEKEERNHRLLRLFSSSPPPYLTTCCRYKLCLCTVVPHCHATLT